MCFTIRRQWQQRLIGRMITFLAIEIDTDQTAPLGEVLQLLLLPLSRID